MCNKCGRELQIGDFPFCKGKSSDHEPGTFNVQPDEIPGGIEIKNGLCNSDGSPRRYYSRSEIAKEAQKRGYTNYVQHVGSRGSDKSKHTVRWV